MKKTLLRERFQQLAGIKPLYELEEISFGQKATGFIDRIGPFFKNLSPSLDGAEIEKELTDAGISTNGVTYHEVIPDPKKKPNQSFKSFLDSDNWYSHDLPKLPGAGFSDDEQDDDGVGWPIIKDLWQLPGVDPKMEVKVNQHQIDKATMDSSFRTVQTTFNLSDNVPKIKGKEFILNLKTGKYEDMGERVETLELGSKPTGPKEDDVMVQMMKDQISITLEDLLTRVKRNK